MCAMWAERDGPHKGKVVGYMCLIDFEFELGGNSYGNRVFPSEEECLEHCPCSKACGMVEVAVEFIRIVRPGTENRGAE